MKSEQTRVRSRHYTRSRNGDRRRARVHRQERLRHSCWTVFLESAGMPMTAIPLLSFATAMAVTASVSNMITAD